MSTLEERLTILSTEYGRYPWYGDRGSVGFVGRNDVVPKEMYSSLDAAIQAEAKLVRALMVEEHDMIKSLEKNINTRLVHLGVLEI